MTRIVAGQAGGRTLAVPPRGTRPTSERVREALFSRLEHVVGLDGARVLDLYAGSGALGLEAASRGAQLVVLVEHDRAAAQVCRANAASTGLAQRVRVVADRVERFLDGGTDRFDLVLVDPPYAVDGDALDAVLTRAADLLEEDGWLVVERSTRSPGPSWPAGLTAESDRRYGETHLWFARR
ncbi:16S rRNA (guanine(966)-N(2))-methyltransferase RsmD [Cellulomonas citrea]|uniref:16S rRNA (guanine(966)-N(2))-methyltransferase RsmD n=1 Tax=Cellulomonas citrea TaxID=1909423 RepID=UPI00135ABA05|nr:16S rRNA (guanine(966)-N(2))-methyltransferase RsmD [Cellulomonas citrea]